MAGWIVVWLTYDPDGIPNITDPSSHARFERKDDAIMFAQQKAKELGRDVQLIDHKTPGDYPMWRVILGWYPSSVWYKVSPDGRVERTESPEEFFQRTLRATRR